MNAADLSELLREANLDAWESVSAAQATVTGQAHPRAAWLLQHVADTKRAYWALVTDATGLPGPQPEVTLDVLMRWEVRAAASLTEQQLGCTVTHSGRAMSVRELLRLNARHSVWHAGQVAALAGRRTA